MRHALLVLCLMAAGCGASVSGPRQDDDGDSGGDASDTDGQLPGDSGADDDVPPAEALVCPSGSSTSGPVPNGVVPGALTTPFPTLRNATVAWAITGDADRDSVVDVRFRVQGTATWRAAMPLFYAHAGDLAGFSWETRHTGSIFGLEPGTTYDLQARLQDPDGGCVVRSASVTTRPVPATSAPATKTATTANYATIVAGAAPGDVIEFAAGTYAGFSLGTSGSAASPIVLRANGVVTVNGDVGLIGRSHVALTGFTVNGRVRINGTTNVAITRNTVTTTGDGIVADGRSENAYIADNVVSGATTWSEAALGVSGDNVGEGIVVTGPGHVIEHNRVRGFRDCISFFEDDEAVDQYSIDVIANDVSECADDGVEADFCAHDCRIVGNRFTNVFMAMSSQPSLGGPTYFIRNVAFNVVLSAFKLQRSSIGDVVLHNTVVKNGDALGIYTDDVFARQVFRNNLFIGGPGGTYNTYANGTGNVMALAAADASGSYDYDAFGSTASGFSGRLGATTFSSLEALRSTTTEAHAVQVDMSVFAAAVSYPANPFPAMSVPDLRLASGNAAVGAALAIPNINDDASGADCGAYALGAALPNYGPRP